MKQNLLALILPVVVASNATADTYLVSDMNGTSSDAPKVVAAHAARGACAYGDKSVNIGDTVVVEGTDVVLVCASGQQSAVFYPLSQSGAKQVIATLPATNGSLQSAVTSAESLTPRWYVAVTQTTDSSGNLGTANEIKRYEVGYSVQKFDDQCWKTSTVETGRNKVPVKLASGGKYLLFNEDRPVLVTDKNMVSCQDFNL